jgi:hypothetical protein
LPEAERDHGANVTHGICAPHAETVRAELRTRRARTLPSEE